MKKKIILIASMFIALLICGCVDTNITLDIDKSGDTTLYSDVLVKDYLFKRLSEEDLESLKEQSDSIEKITAPGKSGYRITKKLGNLKELKKQEIEELISEGEFKDLIEIKNDKNIFYDTYDIKINIKDYMLESKDTSTTQEVSNMILSALDNSSSINFNFKAPFELLESNSTISSENDSKYIYTWNYTPNNMDNINVKVKVYNIKNIIMISIASIVIIGILIFTALKINKIYKVD